MMMTTLTKLIKRTATITTETATMTKMTVTTIGVSSNVNAPKVIKSIVGIKATTIQ